MKLKKEKLEIVYTETFRTPLWLWKALIKEYPQLIKGIFLDPSAGCGTLMLEVLQHNNNKHHTIIDIRPEEMDHWKKQKLHHKINLLTGDFLSIPLKQKYDSILTNPPFSLTMPFVEKSLELLNTGGSATFLQRLDFLSSLKRAQWFKNVPLKTVIVLSKRPMWTKIDHTAFKSSDSRDYCFFVFEKGFKEKPTIEWLFIDPTISKAKHGKIYSPLQTKFTFHYHS